MSSSKDPSPLFEVMRRQGPTPPRRKFAWPEWLRWPIAKVSEIAPSDRPVSDRWWARVLPSEWASRVMAIREPIVIRVPLWLPIVAGATAVMLVIIIAWAGYYMGYRTGIGKYQSYDASLASLQETYDSPPRALIPSYVPGAADGPAQQAGRGASVRAGGSGGSRAVEPSDPRDPGRNYFRLMELPSSAKGEGERALTFLLNEGVDAALIPIKNGGSFKLVSLRPFSKISTDEARQYQNLLRSLGRKWKAKHRGATDWSDLYAEKYIPGRT